MKTFKEVKQTTLKGISPREGELIITKIQRAKKHGELIRDAAEINIQPRKQSRFRFENTG